MRRQIRSKNNIIIFIFLVFIIIIFIILILLCVCFIIGEWNSCKQGREIEALTRDRAVEPSGLVVPVSFELNIENV